MDPIDLAETFLALNGTGRASLLPGPDFMARLAASPGDMAYLVGVYPTTADWPQWEMHPDGHELLVLLDGRLEMHLDDAGAISRRTLLAGSCLVVPPGVWHRADVVEPGRLLGVTYGQGTQHRPA